MEPWVSKGGVRLRAKGEVAKEEMTKEVEVEEGKDDYQGDDEEEGEDA